MGITLNKGGNLSLSKAAPTLVEAMVGLGWDARTTSGLDFDLDASALLVNEKGRVRADTDFIFYNQLGDVTTDGRSADPARASVIHQGDNLTGDGDGDDEQILLRLDRIPSDVHRVVMVVSIHDAITRSQSFGQVRNAFIRLVDHRTGVEVVRYDLSEDYGTETALAFAEVYREPSGQGWKFRAVGQGYNDGLRGIARDFGVNL